MYCGSGPVFSSTEGIGSSFHALRARTHFRRYRGRRVPFSNFARSDLFSAVTSLSGPYFLFCAPVLIFSCTECVGSRFHVLLSGLVFSGTEGVRSRFHVLLPELIFGGTEGVGSRFHVLHARTHFRLYRGRWVPFSCSARPHSFSAVSRASSFFFMFCGTGLIFGGSDGVRSRSYVLCPRTRVRRYRGRRVLTSCFAFPYSFSAVSRVSAHVFIFCAF
jgi:hypothetical protein